MVGFLVVFVLFSLCSFLYSKKFPCSISVICWQSKSGKKFHELLHGKRRVMLQNGAQRSIKHVFLLRMSVSIVRNRKHALHKCGKSETFPSWKKNMQKRTKAVNHRYSNIIRLCQQKFNTFFDVFQVHIKL